MMEGLSHQCVYGTNSLLRYSSESLSNSFACDGILIFGISPKRLHTERVMYFVEYLLAFWQMAETQWFFWCTWSWYHIQKSIERWKGDRRQMNPVERIWWLSSFFALCGVWGHSDKNSTVPCWTIGGCYYNTEPHWSEGSWRRTDWPHSLWLQPDTTRSWIRRIN